MSNKETNQSLYVAMTRPRNKLVMFSELKEGEFLTEKQKENMVPTGESLQPEEITSVNDDFEILEDVNFNNETGEGFVLKLKYKGELKKDIPLKNRDKKVKQEYESLIKLRDNAIKELNNIKGTYNEEGNFNVIENGNYKSTIYLKRLNLSTIEEYKEYQLNKIKERFGNDSDLLKEAENKIAKYEDVDNVTAVYLNDDGSIQGSLGTVGIEIPKQIQGKGFGKNAYRALGNYLKTQGLNLKSDPLGHSESAHRVWESLVKTGEAKIIKGKSTDVDKNFYTAQYEYVEKTQEITSVKEKVQETKKNTVSSAIENQIEELIRKGIIKSKCD
jgi:hypothetical protein